MDAASALTVPAQRPLPPDDWKDDPSADERWNAGVDCAMKLFCDYLGVDPNAVTWDAATETVDGDISAVIGNILRTKYGEDWSPASPPEQPAADTVTQARVEGRSMDDMTKDKAIDHAISVAVIAAALSIPGLLFAAYWFDDASIAAWAVIPFILFMAG
jgi:hypothetical protein